LTLVFRYAPPRVICPSCQFAADLSACDVGQITGMFPRVFCPHEGRFAIVTKRGAGDAVDAYRAEDECVDKWTAKSWRPDISTLVSSQRDDPLAMVARKPDHQGDHEGNR